MRATIDREGRIALGPELRSQLDVHPGDEVILEKHGDEWTIKAAHGESGLCFDGNVLVHRGVLATNGVDPLPDGRDERFEQLSAGLTR